ncbi:SPOR domain-containing protein [Alcaligenaceae bacterium]|nr:SPOR domain-containing protein [Alcaligenaceae bacterium]
MGLFSRNEPSASTGRRSAARTGVSSEAQAAELRIRARRRLIGALVLVLTAIIFVPMLFDSPPEEELASPVVLPEPMPAMPSEPQVALAPEPVAPLPSDSGAIETPAVPAEPDTPATVADSSIAAAPEPPPQKPPAKPESPPEAAKPPAKPPAPAANQRTDDGSVALALLEGRQPPKPAASAPAASSGSVVLQVAAYTTESDAQSRREKLVAAGVTNAYVENAVANGKTAYRLRVGPFPTREAAEAAQARLRQLGYNNGLIFTK